MVAKENLLNVSVPDRDIPREPAASYLRTAADEIAHRHVRNSIMIIKYLLHLPVLPPSAYRKGLYGDDDGDEAKRLGVHF